MTGVPSDSPGLFLGLDPADTSYEDARVVVLPIPYEGTVSFGAGTSLGPDAIIGCSREVELWDEELDFEPWREGVHTHAAVRPGPTPGETMARIADAAKALADDGKLVLGLGGEHSVTPPLVEVVRARHGDVSVLQLDAHADLREEWGGTALSHACTAARLIDGGPVVVVGARAFCAEEDALSRRRGVPLFRARELARRRPEDWIPEVVEALGPRVYVSFDVDALDPSIMPSTGTPVPGGMLWWDSLALLRAVAREREIVGLDLVELAPIPGLTAPDFLAAQLAHKMIGYALART